MALPNQRRSAWCPAYFAVTSRAPYGYRLRWEGDEVTLEPDPLTAPVVQRIFTEYVNGDGLQAIAERLTADGILRPSAYDRRRNPHHSGSAWSKPTVRAIITNSRYAADDAAADARQNCDGCNLRCANRHPVGLVSVELYRQTQQILASRGRGQVRRPTCRYALRGLLRCGLCQRLMQGTWNNNAAYYRCRFPREYARAHCIDHPPNIYLREDHLVKALLTWICRSLPVQLHDWAERRSPAIRTQLVERCRGLRGLVSDSWWDRTQSAELFSVLSLQLVYEPGCNILQVSAEVLRGTVVQGELEL